MVCYHFSCFSLNCNEDSSELYNFFGVFVSLECHKSIQECFAITYLYKTKKLLLFVPFIWGLVDTLAYYRQLVINKACWKQLLSTFSFPMTCQTLQWLLRTYSEMKYLHDFFPLLPPLFKYCQLPFKQTVTPSTNATGNMLLCTEIVHMHITCI